MLLFARRGRKSFQLAFTQEDVWQYNTDLRLVH